MNGLNYDPSSRGKAADQVFMGRCMDLAKRGGKAVRPNPMVGAVLVYEGNIIGEGYHEKYGKAHAEVNCIQNVAIHQRKLIPQSTLYVSLEPCNIVGKTPACSDLILSERIPGVVVGATDPNPLVNGNSIEHLRSKGVHVTAGVCQNEAEALIRPFSVNMNHKRPYVILKIVKSSDNYIGRAGEKIWLSNEYSTVLSHKWRSEADGILAGTNTVINDNPLLTNRLYPGEHPVRIILDRTGKIPRHYQVFSGDTETVVFTEHIDHNSAQANTIQVDFSSPDFISALLQHLFNLKIYVLLVEGGASLIRSFLTSGIWDEARVITCPQKLGFGISAPNITGKLISRQMVLRDQLQVIYHN